MKNKILVAWCFILASSFHFTALLGQQRNTLLILVDDLGRDYTPCYKLGTDLPKTPHIDSLAKNGIIFKNAYANPVCSPTRATILTGRYSFRTGIGTAIIELGNESTSPGISLNEFTIPKGLAASPTSTSSACIGKWHLDDSSNGKEKNPNLMGFPLFSGSLSAQLPNYYRWEKVVNGTSSSVRDYAPDVNVKDATDWIDANKNNPWFVWLAFNSVHTPFHLPPIELHDYDTLSPNPLRTIRNPIPYYKAMVQAVDTEIGKVLLHLKQTGELENTNIIYVSDNGTTPQVVQAPYDPSRSKNTIYENGCNVPLIISGPDVVSPGRECTGLVNTVDIFSTILELHKLNVSTTVPQGITLDSKSLLPYLKNPSCDNIREWAFMEVFAPENASSNFLSKDYGRALRNETFKYLKFDEGREELYNLIEDPLEKNNLLDNSLTSVESENLTYLKGQLAALLRTNGAVVLNNQEAEQNNIINISPNPTEDGLIQVELSDYDGGEGKIEIFNLLGMKVKSIPLTSQKQTLNIAALPGGYYYLTLEKDATIKTIKIYKR